MFLNRVFVLKLLLYKYLLLIQMYIHMSLYIYSHRYSIWIISYLVLVISSVVTRVSFRLLNSKNFQFLADSAEVDSILHTQNCVYCIDDHLGVLLNRETDSNCNALQTSGSKITTNGLTACKVYVWEGWGEK